MLIEAMVRTRDGVETELDIAFEKRRGYDEEVEDEHLFHTAEACFNQLWFRVWVHKVGLSRLLAYACCLQ